MKKEIIVFLDRDGTITYDDKYHLGRQRDWKKMIKILPGVVEGIKKLNKAGIKIYIITNQPGTAVKDFKLLTRERANKVCSEVINQLEKRGAKIQGFFICHHATPDYVRKHKEWKFDKKLINNKCKCRKPQIGMIKEALVEEELKLKDVNVYVIGDRASDVKAGINAKGYGVFVPFENREEEPDKVNKIKGKKYISKNFKDAISFILIKEKK